MVTQSIKQTVQQTIFLRIDGSRSVNADLNIRSKSITNLLNQTNALILLM